MPANYRQVDSVERKLDWSSRRRFLTNGLVAGSAALAFVATNVQVYFCDPHSPWQRGSNENTNGFSRARLIRRRY